MNRNELTHGLSGGRRRGNPVTTLFAAVMLTASLFSACSAGDEAQEFPQGDGLPLSFLTTVEKPQTRAELNTGNLTTIGVFAYLTKGDFSESAATSEFMFNQKVERTNSTKPWTYSPLKYWSNNDTDKLSFFAYAPYMDGTTLGGNNLALTYTVSAAEADQADLLVSLPLMNQTYSETGGNIRFTMKHVLAKVKFSIKSEVGIKVTALTVNNVPETATLTFTDNGFSWGSYTGTKTCTATLPGGGTNVTANATDALTVATFFLLPGKASATFSITYTQDGDSPLEIKKSNVAFPTDWIQEGGVNYLLNVKKDGTMTATVANDWTTDTGGNLSGKEKGISTSAEWVSFAKTWNANGLPTSSDGTPDYTLYEDYGWYETKGTDRVFTIKLTSSFLLTGVSSGELYVPVGTEDHPLTLPIDGQGWEIGIDLQNSSQSIAGEYSGIVGYTQAGISNLRVRTISSNSASTGSSIESTNATYAGVLAGKVDGDILNCSVELVKTTVINTNTSATSGMYLGGLVGYCGGNILNSAVYEGTGAVSASKVSFTQASTGSGIGGLVGGMASGKTVNNCYVQLSELNNQGGDGNTPSAGWLVGDKTGASFNSCHYKSGTASGCTPDDTSTGISTFTDFTGLRSSLNAEADKHTGWALWKEVINTGDNTVEQVVLNLYR
jgi:hypothetical protein